MKDLEFHAFGFEHFDNSNEAIVLDDVGFDNVKKGQGGFTGTPLKLISLRHLFYTMTRRSILWSCC
ncbi:hypothetical protein [Nonlabens sp.]|uniref:hypothetical protein n=1 Tax=Nonlabens sp. TaxID=1888209 RepID=UPI0025CEDCEC|nr:hypothetical protein [Nonlabens sp.]